MRAVLVLLAALTAAAVPAAAGEDPAPTYDDTASTVRFINAAPGTPDLRVRIDDEDVTRAFGDAGPFARVRSGPHQVALASGGVVDTETFSFAAATAYDLVAAFERDPGGGSRPHLALHAVPLDRVTSGLAGVRFVSANGTLGTVVLSISSAGGTTALTAPPRTSSVRVGVPAGPVRFTVGASDHDEIYRALAAVLEPDAFVSVVWIAGGEESARLVVVGDGAQPHERPIPGLAVNTGLPPGGSARLLASAAPAVALAFALAATTTTSALRTWRRRDLAAALAAVLLLAACSAALPPTAAPSDAAASPGRAALSGTSVAPIPATAAATAIIATTATGTAPPVRVLASAGAQITPRP